MADIIPNERKCHKITLIDDYGKTQIVLIGSGEGSYLWIGNQEGMIAMVEGGNPLRALASAILKELGE